MGKKYVNKIDVVNILQQPHFQPTEFTFIQSLRNIIPFSLYVQCIQFIVKVELKFRLVFVSYFDNALIVEHRENFQFEIVMRSNNRKM